MKPVKLLNKLTFSLALVASLVSFTNRTQAATPYAMSSGTYLENFSDIANWANNFTAGIGAAPYGSVAVVSNGVIPNPQTMTTATTTFLTNTSSSTGIERGSGNLVFLTTGGTDNTTAIAIDLHLDFTGQNAGTFSYDWAEIGNGSGPREGSIKIYTTVDGTTYTELTAAFVSVTNGVAASGTISAVALPANFNNSSTAVIRFYNYNGGVSPTGAGGSRPKISIDNVTVTSSASGSSPASITGISPSSISTNAGSTVQFTVSATGSSLSYYWFKQAGAGSNLIAGATTAVLTLSNVLTADATNYTVVVSNSLNRAVSSPVSLAVVDPVITVQPPATVNAIANTTAKFPITVLGTPTLTYQWYLGTPGSGTVINNGGRISGATSSNLTITTLVTGDSGNYYVIAANGLGNSVTSTVVALTVNTTGVLAEWDFNGPFNVTNPLPSIGTGTSGTLNGVVGSSAAGATDDSLNASHEGLANNAWSITTYPAAAVSNKTAGVTFAVNTTGLRNIKIADEIRASNTGSKYTRLQYTTNGGTSFVDYPVSTAFVNPTFFETESYDLTGLPGVRNNPNFGFRFVSEFESTALYGTTSNAAYDAANGGTYGTGGTIRYDILTVNADSITGSGTVPTITSIANITVKDTDAATNVTFTVGDAETAAGSLIVSAVSGNQSALPSGDLSPGGSGASRTLTITPSPGSTGPAPVLVTVTDGDGDTTTTSFLVNVVPGNRAPTISSIASTNMLINTNLTLAFTVSDDRTPASGLTVTASSGNTTLLPNANIVLGGSGSNLTVSIVPAANLSGVVPVIITVNDNDVDLPKSASNAFVVEVRPNTNIILNDFFDYANGSLITNSGGFWIDHSGTPGQMQVTGAKAVIDDTLSEDTHAVLIGGPYTTNSGKVLYAAFTVNFSVAPSSPGSYFAHFMDTNTGAATGYGARVWASALNAASGSFRLGVGNGQAATNTSGQIPTDLSLNTDYKVVVRFVPSTGLSTIWINPTAETDPTGVTATDISGDPTNVVNQINVVAFGMRENSDEGILTLDNLRIGLTFASVSPSPILQIQPSGSNVILTWSDSSFNLYSSTTANGTYTLVSGAVSPYTTATTGAAQFFHLGH